jgi:hypothetical protein
MYSQTNFSIRESKMLRLKVTKCTTFLEFQMVTLTENPNLLCQASALEFSVVSNVINFKVEVSNGNGDESSDFRPSVKS